MASLTHADQPDIRTSPPPHPSVPSIAQARPSERRLRLRVAVIAFLIAGVVAAVSIRVLTGIYSAPAANVVRTSGRIEGRQTTIAPKDIQGRVKRLLVDEGATVTRGQLLAELEANQLDARHAALTANLANLDVQIHQASLDVSYTAASTAATVAAADAAVSGARAHVARAKAVLVRSRADYERAVNLFGRGVIAGSALDEAEMALHTGEADADAADKDLAQAQSNLALAQASRQTIDVKRQQVNALRETRRAVVAQIAEADANLAERKIVAPVDGTILSRPVEVGDVVSPGSPVFVMVDMNRLYVKVYIPEPDIGKLRLGDPADVSVDAFPDRTFAARVTKIYQQAEFTPKNVETQEERLKLVFGVELSFVQAEGLLKPGMPADGVIHWTSGVSQTRHDP
jgi:multidrug resistance efflux pump